MSIVGIDPGAKGGIVHLSFGGRIEGCYPLQLGLDHFINRSWVPIHVFIEKAQVMAKKGSKQGVVGMFNYGTGFGEILGIMRALKLPHTLVHPKTWTKTMHLGTSVDLPKIRSLEAARRIFPNETWILPNCRKPHDGIIDAALIAEFGRRILG